MPKRYTPTSAAADVEAALRLLEGRWKLVILFHLFGGKVMRFSDLERAIPNITQKMLGQQLRGMAADGIVVRTAYPQVPPKVEYRLTSWGQSLCPTLDAILKWADRRPADRKRAPRADGLLLLNNEQTGSYQFAGRVSTDKRASRIVGKQEVIRSLPVARHVPAVDGYNLSSINARCGCPSRKGAWPVALDGAMRTLSVYIGI